MSSPSPGPGWWMASDGKWYPQKWEYWRLTWTHENLDTLAASMQDEADKQGQMGWEMVGVSTTHTHTGSETLKGITKWFYRYSMTCFFKRPIAP